MVKYCGRIILPADGNGRNTNFCRNEICELDKLVFGFISFIQIKSSSFKFIQVNSSSTENNPENGNH